MDMPFLHRRLHLPDSLSTSIVLFITIEVTKPSVPEDINVVLGSICFTDESNREFLCDFSQYKGSDRKENDKHYIDLKASDFDLDYTCDSSHVIPLEWSQLQQSYTLEEVSLDVELSTEDYVPYRFLDFTIALFDDNARQYIPLYTSPLEELMDLNKQTNWKDFS